MLTGTETWDDLEAQIIILDKVIFCIFNPAQVLRLPLVMEDELAKDD